MGCFLGCFGGEAGSENRERRRRPSGKRSPPRRERLNRRIERNGAFQAVAMELGQSSRRQITPRLSPSPSLEPPVQPASRQKNPLLEPPVESVARQKNPLLEPPVDPVPSENSLDPPVELVNPTVQLVNPSVQPVNRPVQPVNLPVQLVDPPILLVNSPSESINTPVVETRDAKQQSSTSPPKKKVTFNLNVKTYEHPNYPSDDEPQEDEPVREKLKPSPTRTAFPSNHRYQNWYQEAETDETEQEDQEEEEEEEYYYSDEEYEELDEIDEGNEEESYESLFSLSIDKETETSGNNNIDKNEVNSSISENNTPEKKVGPRDRSQFVHPVLNPVENLSQWKDVKCNKITLNSSNLEKENKNLNNNDNNGLIKREISVDASLSTWLVSSENNSTVDQGQNGNFGDKDIERPILGALTVDDMKQSSVNSSPRRSPSREDEPIIGTVGTYWSRTSTGTSSASSRFREDKIAKCR